VCGVDEQMVGVGNHRGQSLTNGVAASSLREPQRLVYQLGGIDEVDQRTLKDARYKRFAEAGRGSQEIFQESRLEQYVTPAESLKSAGVLSRLWGRSNGYLSSGSTARSTRQFLLAYQNTHRSLAAQVLAYIPLQPAWIRRSSAGTAA
jgi:hypothetical protein